MLSIKTAVDERLISSVADNLLLFTAFSNIFPFLLLHLHT